MSNVVDKLKKLIAMEQSARKIGNQAEAEAFAAKVAQLLTDHKLTMSKVEFEAQAKADPFGCEQVTQKSGTVWSWRIRLAQAVAESLFCKSFYRTGVDTITFVGRDSDRHHAITMYSFLVESGKSLVNKELRNARKLSRLSVSDVDWRKSFLRGFADGISARLENQTRVMLDGQSATGLIKRDAHALDLYIKGAMSVRNPSRRPSHAVASDAYSRGVAHGSKTGFGTKLQLGNGR